MKPKSMKQRSLQAATLMLFFTLIAFVPLTLWAAQVPEPPSGLSQASAQDEEATEGAPSSAKEPSEAESPGQDPKKRNVETRLSGDIRYFQFVTAESTPTDGHAERGVLRLKSETKFGGRWKLEAHGLIEGSSPPALGAGFSLGGARATRRFDFDADLSRNEDRLIRSDVDRLSLRYDHPRLRLTVGRQAVTWGINYFWPVLDLFAPFSPERIDRDYKPGVDAVRGTIPIGQFSEIELIGALQGQDTDEDRSVGALGRFHLGSADLGVMVGSFHRDTVIGAFLTGDFAGSLLRGEVAYTEPGERARSEGDPSSFVRATVGLDRLLSPTTSLILETTWNGYGSDDPAEYASLAQRERFARGEVTSFGELASGVSLGFQAHPLLSLSASVLVNWADGSVLLQPGGSWSLSDNGDALFGVIAGLGDDESDRGLLASEYGAVAVTFWGALRWSF